MLFRTPELPAEARRTFRFHLAYALLDAAAGGIVLNAPFLALRAMGGRSWQLPMRELCAGAGMVATLYLGSWMARRRKMPFVFVPGMLCATTLAAMVAATGDAAWFLLFFSISALFEVITRPAIAAILRDSYPAVCRGQATGEVRKWSSLVFVGASLLAAYVLQQSGEIILSATRALFATAAVLSLSSFVCFRKVRVLEAPAAGTPARRLEIARHLTEAVGVFRDGRYRRYLLGCFADGFCAMLYYSLIVAFFEKGLSFGYVESTAFLHAIPAMTAFAATGWLGRWFDRSNPWVSWGWIRVVWGLDALLLAATPLAATFWAWAIILLPLTGRLLRGSVQGGQAVLFWQIGVTHFAPPGEDTSRYMGVLVFLNGAIRLAASAASMILVVWMKVQPGTLLLLGGSGVVLSGIYSFWQGRRESREHRPATVAEFEAQFTAEAAARQVAM